MNEPFDKKGALALLLWHEQTPIAHMSMKILETVVFQVMLKQRYRR